MKILVVGSGIVGQATGKGMARKGHEVSYVDINTETVKRLRAEGLNAKFIPQVNWSDVELVMMTVSTPSGGNGSVVLEYIENAAADVGRGIAQTDNYVTVVVRSTVPPGTTEGRIGPIIERHSGKLVGDGFGLAMNPEFLRQKSNIEDFARPWATVIGTTDNRTRDVLEEIYRPFGALIITCSPTEAEMVKYANNLYNAQKISFFNEVGAICDEIGIDGNVVGAAVARTAESMWNPLYGTRTGVPYGGTCLPKDTSAMMAWCQENGYEFATLAATMEVNARLEANGVPAVTSPDQIDSALEKAKMNPRREAQAPPTPLRANVA